MNLNNLGNEGTGHINIYATQFPLMDLPSLILERILTFLDKGALKNLRAVCWTTKNLVEQPKHLQRLRILIWDPSFFEEIKNSTVKWNSICLLTVIWTRTNSPERIYLPLLQSALECLTRLKIKGAVTSIKHLLTFLLNVGPQLRHFVFVGTLVVNENDEVILRRPQSVELQAEVDEMKLKMEEHEDTLHKNLIGLQHVELRNTYQNPGTSFRLLITLLTCCPNLTTLYIPTIDPSEIVKNQIAQLTCEPLLDYLRRKVIGGERQPMLKIDLCRRPTWNAMMTPCKQIECLLPITPSILIEMATLCQQTGVRLYNVPSSALPPSNALTQEQKKSINETVASILCANVLTGIPDTCHIPPCCPVKIIMYNRVGNVEPDLSNFQLPSDSINIVSIICDEEYSKTLVRILFQRVWPTVTELQILNGDDKNEVWSEENGTREKLASVFPMLKKLRLGSISIEPVFDFLDGLEDNLEMLYLGSVKGCLDMASISQWMSKMNKLKYLGLGNNYIYDPSVVLKAPGYFGKLKWHTDD